MLKLRQLINVFSFNCLLQITVFAGVILIFILSSTLTVFYLIERSGSKAARQEDNFYSMLREYDLDAITFTGTEKEIKTLNRNLDRLEKKALSVETWLSILKRRRAVQAHYTQFPELKNIYRDSIKRAQKEFPLSESIAALAAAAIVKDSALTKDTEEQLRGLLPLLSQSGSTASFYNLPELHKLRLNLHVLLGDFKDPQTAAAVLQNELAGDENEIVTQDIAILKVIRGDLRGAAADIQTTLGKNAFVPSDNFVRFAAEYYYDFGDLRRSAELFSYLKDDFSALRQADALHLAGFLDSAKSLWLTLAESANGDSKARETSLYNLAVTAESGQDEIQFLEKLVNTQPSSETAAYEAGLIRYSRFLNHDEAIAALRNSKIKPADFPYIDLEISRRNAAQQEAGRQIAEAWLLLDRHPENEDLYKWAAWLFTFQKYYDELKILLNRTEDFNFSGWTESYKAAQFMIEGDLAAAENILNSIQKKDWLVYSNIGRIFEARHSFSRALTQYELASEILNDSISEDYFSTDNPIAASAIYFRMASCLTALSRPIDTIAALQQSVELNPDNHIARLELDRLLR